MRQILEQLEQVKAEQDFVSEDLEQYRSRCYKMARDIDR